jgi:hypothetical protein
MIRNASPAILESASDIRALLCEAEKARVLVLSRHGVVRVEHRIADAVRDLEQDEERRPGKGSREILAGDSTEDVGHGPFWIDAGSVYEDLLSLGSDTADIIFCLDPWAAQLIRDEDAASGARWYIISDLGSRKSVSYEEYWGQLEEWFERRPFAGIILREAWIEALGSEPTDPPADHAASIHLQKPGAWQWRKISGTSEQLLHFLVKFSGSLPHLRVFLDSLARQDCPKDRLQATIVTSENSEDLRRYLRWHALAHPTLEVESVATPHLDRTLESHPGAVLVLTGDHTILPPRFARVTLERIAADGCPSLYGVPLSAEASAHVLTGNLDPVAHYESLLEACSHTSSAEAVRLVPPESWMGGELGPMGNIMAYVRESEGARPRLEGPGLLCLGDLP